MLTAKRVARLIKRPGRHRDGDVRGLYLLVPVAGRGSWVLRYERGGRERFMGLGSVGDFTLKEARERARAARQQLANGVDPLDARRDERARKALEAARTVTFKQCAEAYFAAHADEWRNANHRAQFPATMKTYVFPVIGSLPVAAVDEPMIIKVLTPIWKTKTTTAKRVRNRIAAVLDFAAAAKYRTGTNPARWEGNLEFLLPKPDKVWAIRHHPAMPYAEVAAFVAELRAAEGVAPRALEFLILTAARTGEAIHARWDEIDLDAKTWTVPAERMKAGKEHRVPLSDRAVEILEAIPREAHNPFVFIGPRAGSSISTAAMHRTLRRISSDHYVVHGFRSSFSTWAHERTSHAAHDIELSLAHNVGSAVERAYRRSDLFEKRRRLMSDWARFVSTPKPKAADVVPLRAEP